MSAPDWTPTVGDRVQVREGGLPGRAGKLGLVTTVLPAGPFPLYVRLDGWRRRPVACRASELALVGRED